MKKIEDYDVVSLDNKEVLDTLGGSFWGVLAAIYIGDVITNTDAHIEAWKRGWEAGQN